MPDILPTRPHAYTGSPLDRASHLRDDADWLRAALDAPATLWLPVWRGRNLMQGVEAGAPEAVFLSVDAATMREAAAPWALLGLLRGSAVFAVDLSESEDPAPLLPPGAGVFADLRPAAGLLPAGEAAILAHARGLMHWRTTHRFCPNCGAPSEPRSAGNVLLCPACGTQNFPRTDPAVIMLVTRGDHALLGHSQRFPTSTMYSTLAGFVEPGESLEEAVAREVFEETGVRVGRVSYHSSQPWPFPASIMLGFHAEATTEAITIDPAELIDARWFSRAQIRAPEEHGFSIPRRDSIASRLIEDWVGAA
jgi:NAD+ diphosphatase